MLKMKNNSNGFTLIELILVLVLMGVLAISVAPRFANVQANSIIIIGEANLQIINSGIRMKMGNDSYLTGKVAWPEVLDNASVGNCLPTNLCFSEVLNPGAARGWSKDNDTSYTNTETAKQYSYQKDSGNFTCVVGC
jgi:prepilin-type N-terminal cleavage/methylation domain-containing protein